MTCGAFAQGPPSRRCAMSTKPDSGKSPARESRNEAWGVARPAQAMPDLRHSSRYWKTSSTVLSNTLEMLNAKLSEGT